MTDTHMSLSEVWIVHKIKVQSVEIIYTSTVYFNNPHQLTHFSHFHFIKPQNLDMFRPSLVHLQEALHGQFWWV
jgi:hypothetical protein